LGQRRCLDWLSAVPLFSSLDLVQWTHFVALFRIGVSVTMLLRLPPIGSTVIVHLAALAFGGCVGVFLPPLMMTMMMMRRNVMMAMVAARLALF